MDKVVRRHDQRDHDPSSEVLLPDSAIASSPVDNQFASAVFDLAWLAPDYKPTPTDALVRIRAICGMHRDLANALMVVCATHMGMKREILAEVLRQVRPELAPYSRDDVVGMLVAVVNGGRQGFEAVLRTRKSSGAKVINAALPWASSGD
jgi:hypothetical protein